jgi:hypothetical protein
MIRKQIYLHKRQQALLKRLAEARGTSEAEIIRQAIEHEAQTGTQPQAQPDPAALDELIQLARSRRKLGVTAEPYHWNRADAYDERLSQYDKRSA